MNVLLTGSTGFIGANLALKLADSGVIVHALYRSDKKKKRLQHKNIKLFKGDILDRESIINAMKGCQQLYHLAAFTDVWTKDNNLIYKLNVTGTVSCQKLLKKYFMINTKIKTLPLLSNLWTQITHTSSTSNA